MPGESNNQYQWYDTIDPGEGIQQGDFLYKIPVLSLISKIVDVAEQSEESSTVDQEVEVITDGNYIVMTHSCDFQNDTPESFQVLLCPYVEVSKKPKETKSYISKNKWGSTVTDKERDARILPEFSGNGDHAGFFYLKVDLTRVYGVPYGVVKAHALGQGKRIRLLPPYREYLAQAFATRFMRVGLPINLPTKRPYEDEAETQSS